MNKSAFLALIAFVAIAVSVLIFGFIYQKRRVQDFKERGVETTATVVELKRKRVFRRVTSKRSNRRNKYYVKLTYFTQIGSPNDSANEKIISKDSTGAYQMNLKHLSPRIGEFMETEIRISSKSYHELKQGDKITILYLPEDPKKVILQKDLE